MRRLILFLITAFLITVNPVFAFNEDGRGYPASYDQGNGNKDDKTNNTENENDNSGEQQEEGGESGNSNSSSSSSSSSSSGSSQSSDPYEDELEDSEQEKEKPETPEEEIASIEAVEKLIIEEDNKTAGAKSAIETKNAVSELAENLQSSAVSTEKEKNDGNSQNKNTITDKKNVSNAKTTGDPVRITEGFYEQNEVDLQIGKLPCVEIKRKYNSQSPIVSSLGYGWSSNLDQRIILGIDANLEELVQLFTDFCKKISDEQSKLHRTLNASYNISNIYNAKKELKERIKVCSQNITYSGYLISDIDELLANRYQISDFQAKQLIEMRVRISDRLAQLTAKKQSLVAAYNSVDSDIALITSLTEKYNWSAAKRDEYTAKLALMQERKKRNEKVMFTGMGPEYQETGFGTLNFIDEEGFPHLFYETEAGSSCWKNEADKKYLRCEKLDTGFILYESDGTQKVFDEAGFLIQVQDRNNNTITLRRDTNEMLEYIETSANEHIRFEYQNNFLRKIINLRDVAENVEFEYQGNKLVAVKDFDGDRVTMDYDSNGQMVRLNKCDGSCVTFEYGQITSDGKLLTTATINEEGFSEFFEYDRSEKRTDYTDHDGKTFSYWYDSNHRTIKEINPDGKIAVYSYDDEGNLRTVEADGQIINYLYDDRGNRIKATYSDGSCELWDYNDFNQISSFVDCDGVRRDYLYDERGNLVEERKDGQKVYSLQVNSFGQVICRTQYGQHPVKTIYTYDDYGNLKKEVSGTSQTEYEYDGRGRLVKIIYNGNVLSQYKYEKNKTEYENYNGLRITYLTNGRKDITDIMRVDLKTDTHQNIRIEYDKRHLPVHVFQGDGREEKLVLTYVYSPEGKVKAQIQHGNENWISIYEYKNDEIAKVRKIKSSSSEIPAYEDLSELAENAVCITYDAEKEPVEKFFTSAEKLEYYPDGSLKSSKDKNGRLTEYIYDGDGRLQGRLSSNQKLWYQYDNMNRLTSIIAGPSSDKTSAVYCLDYEYFADGRTLAVTEGEKYKSNYELDAFGNVIAITDGNGNQRQYLYDYKNNLVSSADGYGNKTFYEYNALNKISKITLPDGSQTIYEYDSLGNLVKVSDECGIVYEAEYDGEGKLLRERERGDSQKKYVYDENGFITELYYGNKKVEAYTYDFSNRSIKVTDGRGADYLYKYDASGHLINERNRMGDNQQYFYDNDGQFKSKRMFNGETMSIKYSPDCSEETMSYSDGLNNSYLYDEAGNILETQNAYGKTIYQYDKGGRLIYQKDVTSGKEVFYEYDDNGNRIKLLSQDRETLFSYGRNNEVKEIFDNKQRLSVKLEYDKNGRELLKRFGNSTRQESHYDKAGRLIVTAQLADDGTLLWGEGYVYGPDGKRTSTVDSTGRVTFYEYNSSGKLSSVYLPYSKELIDKLKNEALLNGLPIDSEPGENRFLTSAERAEIIPLLNLMQNGLGYNLSNIQTCIKENYEYDLNGNRTAKITSFGKIQYFYDEENCLLASGSRGQAFVNYSYDKTGNLLKEESVQKIIKYAYNSQNRLIYCEVTDNEEKTYSQTSYAYDTFGRRVLVQDNDDVAIRTVYDGLTFDLVEQSPVMANGLFTDSAESGTRWGKTGRPTGDRYRYLSEEDSDNANRYYRLETDTYKTKRSRYRGVRVYLNVNGNLAAQSTADGPHYYAVDLLGSIAAMTDNQGTKTISYTYDPFGSMIQGQQTSASDYGYLGKQHDPTSRLYNYGYRDYSPSTSRFTTLDPLRDGPNWFTYCNNDPVNFIDPNGLAYRDRYGVWRSDNDVMYKLEAAMNNHYKDEYITALNMNQGESIYRCDDYVQKVLKESGLYKDSDFAGDSSQKTVANHIQNAKANDIKKNLKKKAPELKNGEVYVVFMGDSYKGYSEHCGIVRVGSDGTVYYSDNSSGNKTKKRPRGGVATSEYDSLQKFQNDYGYNSFYYEPISTKKNK